VAAGETVRVTFLNELRKGRITVRKTDVTDGGEEPMADVAFLLTSEGGETEELITGEDGTAESPWLPLGRYTLSEKYTEGYLPADPVTVDVTEDGGEYTVPVENRLYESSLLIRKTDSGTGLTVKAAGTLFRVTDAEGNDMFLTADGEPYLIETGSDGTAEIPAPLRYGSYLVFEERAPEGYVPASEPAEITVDPEADSSGMLELVFPDDPVTGAISIEKKGLMFTGVQTEETAYGTLHIPVWEERYLAGAVFRVTAAQEISTADGTVRLREGEEACTLTTGEDGTAVSGELFPGLYRVEETEAPEGFSASGAVDVSIAADAGASGAVNVSIVSVTDEPLTADVGLIKTMEISAFAESAPYSDTLFGLYAGQELVSSGGQAIPEGALIELMVPGEDGRCAASSALPQGSYFVRELETAEGYVPDTADHAVPDGGEVSISNRIARGDLSLQKLSGETGGPLAGAVFELSRAGGEKVCSFTTGEDGKYYLSGLEYGEYILRETSAPRGYVRSDEEICFCIAEDGAVAEITLTNEKMQVPDTGGSGVLSLAVPLLTGAAAIAAAAAYIKRKRRGDDV